MRRSLPLGNIQRPRGEEGGARRPEGGSYKEPGRVTANNVARNSLRVERGRKRETGRSRKGKGKNIVVYGEHVGAGEVRSSSSQGVPPHVGGGGDGVGAKPLCATLDPVTRPDVALTYDGCKSGSLILPVLPFTLAEFEELLKCKSDSLSPCSFSCGSASGPNITSSLCSLLKQNYPIITLFISFLLFPIICII